MTMTFGYTTGVFDLFHVGHLNLLRHARERCDRLLVGVTTDELCLSRKAKRPVIPFEDRLEIVRSIRYVDDAIAQTSMNKVEAWERIRFHRMFVGDDWKGTRRWNELEVQFAKFGVDIVYFPYTRRVSSSSLRSILSQA